MTNSTIVYPVKTEYVWNFWPKVSYIIRFDPVNHGGISHILCVKKRLNNARVLKKIRPFLIKPYWVKRVTQFYRKIGPEAITAYRWTSLLSELSFPTSRIPWITFNTPVLLCVKQCVKSEPQADITHLGVGDFLTLIDFGVGFKRFGNLNRYFKLSIRNVRNHFPNLFSFYCMNV